VHAAARHRKSRDNTILNVRVDNLHGFRISDYDVQIIS